MVRIAILAAALTAFVVPARATDVSLGTKVVIPNPRGGPGNSYPLDWCYHAGQDCGRPAAYQYCRSRGFDGAGMFRTEHAEYTWIPGEARTCQGSYCTAFIEITCEKFERISVENPMVQGLRADNCRIWAQDCGEGGAKAYCESRGFGFVDKFEVYDKFVGPTYVIGSRRRCDGALCRALSYVECHKTLQPAN